jgi:hypothetical protein
MDEQTRYALLYERSLNQPWETRQTVVEFEGEWPRLGHSWDNWVVFHEAGWFGTKEAAWEMWRTVNKATRLARSNRYIIEPEAWPPLETTRNKET